jgi:Zn-dependent peptidase ImmA (M78 family)
MVRALWHVPSGPISNLVRLIESAGAVVLMRDFETQKLDGMSSWAKRVPPLFYLNSEMPMDRLRWTIAHEVGHLVMHWTAPRADPEEEANLFASELLLPEAETKTDLRQLTFKRLPQLKAYWRVSMFALVKTASVRGALPANKIKSLYVQMSRAGWRSGEPFELERETPSLSDTAISVHMNQHGYSTDELAGIANLWTDEFRALYQPEITERRLRAI